jgi:hypothetical protein
VKEEYEKEKHMPYITSVERHGMERGKREGLLKGITSCLKVRFGAQGLALLPAIQAVEDVDRLEVILTAVETATDLDEIRPLCA